MSCTNFDTNSKFEMNAWKIEKSKVAKCRAFTPQTASIPPQIMGKCPLNRLMGACLSDEINFH